MTRGKNDLVLLAALLAAGLILAVVLLLGAKPGAAVTVEVDGVLQGTYSLAIPRTLTIETPWGTNLLVIEKGTARITQADCPDGICMGRGEISRTGESIVCLPHRLVAAVTGKENEVDIVVH